MINQLTAQYIFYGMGLMFLCLTLVGILKNMKESWKDNKVLE